MSKISVIIPTFNRENFIKSSIDSVTQQTYNDYEIIIVDDGSTDNTKIILDSYGDLIRCITQENAGPAAARNTGIKVARGEYIAFLDSDDLYAEKNLEKKMTLLKDNPEIGWVYSDWQYVDKYGRFLEKGSSRFNYSAKKLTGDLIAELIVCRNFISTCTVVVKKSILEDVGSFDPAIPSQEEYDLWLRISARYSAAYIDEVLVTVTSHASSLSSDFTKWVYGNAIIADKLNDLIPDDFPNKKKTLTRIQADKYTFLGRDLAQRGMSGKALASYWRSIRRLPLQKRVYWLAVLAIFQGIKKNLISTSTSKH